MTFFATNIFINGIITHILKEGKIKRFHGIAEHLLEYSVDHMLDKIGIKII